MPVIEQKTTNKNKVDFDLNRLDKSKTTIFSKYPLFFAEIDAIGENRGYTFCDSATFGSKERFYTLKIDNKDVTWYNK